MGRWIWEKNMTHPIKLALLAGACTLPVLAVPAHAQEAAKQDSSRSADQTDRDIIIVTANKRDENLQDVPISITAFSQEDLDKRGASGLEGIQEATPNLNFSVQSAGQNVARVTLRGVGTETLVGGGDPGVALHIDGVYVGRNSAAAGDIFDVARVEVLRGPQGTLYGRNATGGSVNIITQKPKFQLEGSADITVGNYDAFRVRGVVNVPLSETVATRIAVFSDSHDGYIKNLYPSSQDGADKNNTGGRMQLLWDPGNGTEVLVRGYFSKTKGSGPGTRFLGTDINTANGYPAGNLVGIGLGGQRIVANSYELGTTTAGESILPFPTGFYEFRKDADEYVDVLMKGVDIDASFELGDSMLLRSVSSYQTNDNAILVDSDNSELPLETRYRDSSAKQFSQEFNLISQGDSALKWLLGAYYYHEELTEQFETLAPAGKLPTTVPLPFGGTPGGGGVRQFRVANHQVDSYALFGQASYDITDAFSITAGLRHTWDSKTQDRPTGGQVGLDNNVRAGPGGSLGPDGPTGGQASWAELTYRISANYQVTPDNMLYASYSRGYKSGGFDYNGGALVGGQQVPYNPEFVDAFEVGSKNTFLDRAILLNLTGFYYKYKDLQVFRLTGDGPLTDNAANSTIWGVEAELKVKPTERLTIEGTVGYLNATYDSYSIAIPPTDFTGKTLNYAPEWTVYLAGEYAFPVGDNELTARLDWSWRSETFFDRSNGPFDVQGSYGLLNARLRYDADAYYVDLFGRNLTSSEYVTGQLINPPFNCGCRTVNLGSPMTYGATFGVRF
jgi:iron complex outermembrane receptor protein